jgi:hypothetical protein
MRHLGSIVLSLFLTALVYVLTGVGLANWALALSSGGTSEDYVKLGMALAALGVAGVLYGVLTLTRLSPLGPVLSGLALFGLAMWAALAFNSYTDTMPSRILGVDGTDFAAAGSGAAALLAVPLIATVLSPRRWRRWANPPAAVPAPGYAPAGYGAPAAPAAPYPGQPAAPAYGAPYPTSPAGPSAPQSPSPAYAAPGYPAQPDKTSVMTAPASPAAGYPPPGPAASYGQGAPYGQPAPAYGAGPAYPPPAAPSSAPPAPSGPPPSSGPPAYGTPTSAPPAYGPQQPGAPSSGGPSSGAPSSGPPVWPSAPPAQEPGDQVDPDATRKL